LSRCRIRRKIPAMKTLGILQVGLENSPAL
jgi:hypothetical protein